jgi:hypothetical protein
MKTVLIITSLLALQMSTACVEKSNHQVTMVDSTLTAAIHQYVHENGINLREKVVSVEVNNGPKSTYHISNQNSKLYKESSPSYYALCDSVVVFIYTGFERNFEYHLSLSRELDSFLDRRSVKLKEFEPLKSTYNPPTWRLTECNGNYQLDKKLDPYQVDFVPCGYTLLQDSTNLDSLIVKHDPLKSPGLFPFKKSH